MRCLLYLLIASAMLFSCASWTKMETGHSSRYVITAQEIKESSATNAYEAIQQLRPGLLDRDRRRSVDFYSVSEAVVYVNGVRYGDKESLKSIAALQIEQIRYLPPSEATVKYGSDHSGGAFLIDTK